MSDIDAAFDWLWGSLQGDFNEDPSAGQIVVGTVISMIPFVDQIADVRDLVANLTEIRDEPDDVWAWVALVITLIGFIPVLGSALKGVFKLVLKFAKRGGDASQAVESILALLRGAGKGDPVSFLRNLPYDQYTRQVRVRFDGFMDGLRSGLAKAISFMSSKWVDWALGDTSKRLAILELEMQRLQRLGHDMIPQGMQALKGKVDDLLGQARPAKMEGSTDRTNTLVHSSKPLMRLEYEVGVRRIGDGVAAMRKNGASESKISEWAHQQRRDLGERFKNKTDPDLREIIYKRNLTKYDDPLGPSHADLKRGFYVKADGTMVAVGSGIGKTDAGITEGATRAGGDDLPWDKILEYSRARRDGDSSKAQQLLIEIDAIVNKRRR